MKLPLTVIALILLISCHKKQETYTNSTIFHINNVKSQTIDVVMKEGDPETSCYYRSTFMVKNESDQTFTDCYVLVDFRTYKDGKDSLVYTTDYLRDVSGFKFEFSKRREIWKPNEIKEFTVDNLILEPRLLMPVDSVQVIYFVKSKNDGSVDELLYMDDITKVWKEGQVRVSKIYHK